MYWRRLRKHSASTNTISRRGLIAITVVLRNLRWLETVFLFHLLHQLVRCHTFVQTTDLSLVFLPLFRQNGFRPRDGRTFPSNLRWSLHLLGTTKYKTKCVYEPLVCHAVGQARNCVCRKNEKVRDMWVLQKSGETNASNHFNRPEHLQTI
jgi:hypothetical protein